MSFIGRGGRQAEPRDDASPEAELRDDASPEAPAGPRRHQSLAFLDRKLATAFMHSSDSHLSLRTLLSSALTACNFSFSRFLMICLEILMA